MSATVTIEEAKDQLAQLIDQLKVGEEVVITRNQLPIARLISETAHVRNQRRPGTMKGTVLGMSPDFNEPLDDFKDYMQ